VFVGHFEGVGHELVVIGARLDGIVAAINFGVQRLDFEVEPSIAGRFFVKKQRIAYHCGVLRLFESKSAVIGVGTHVSFFGVHHPWVSTGFGYWCRFCAGMEQQQQARGCAKKKWFHVWQLTTGVQRCRKIAWK
jgi:hypothetical protein